MEYVRTKEGGASGVFLKVYREENNGSGWYQGNLKSTRKAHWSPFLSLYFWHKLIRLEPRKMRGGGLKYSQSLVMAPD